MEHVQARQVHDAVAVDGERLEADHALLVLAVGVRARVDGGREVLGHETTALGALHVRWRRARLAVEAHADDERVLRIDERVHGHRVVVASAA
eukprot:CAMPEP_0198315714 /NCGR_PEP_ID=MMETSP1450-20131203/5885_1 /TAXON_ID=753684 ORGANISM="Madagascaria erythrocladiodes, Strain CCMP3234" /NCGR_SAMPLE_ID=MMETSP1450 /ASSEMBLY_ACC=CAM_ASM_001115 /LENGTH=92 /DNA_ID=CAMNT_0044018839 /DNA_START=91 /DNA_END=366 /DNA_ORIENTATION=+